MLRFRRLGAVVLTVPAMVAAMATGAGAAVPDPEVTATVAPGEAASSATLRKTHHATFTGRMANDKRSGSTADNPYTKAVEPPGTCTEVVKADLPSTGGGVFRCTVTWHFTARGGNICTVDPAVGVVAEADYTSEAGDWTLGNIRLTGAGEAGSGVLTGTFADQARPNGALITITIDASDTCGATDLAANMLGIDMSSASQTQPSQFSGTADYSYRV